MGFSSDAPMQSNQIPLDVEFDVNKPEFNEVLNLAYRRLANAINTKGGASYSIQENASFKQVYGLNDVTKEPDSHKNRNGYRKTINMLVLPAVVAPAATLSVNHGISNISDAVLIYASCKNSAGQLFTLYHPNAYIDATTANIINTSGSDIVQAMFVAEYTKN
jgi:hypothetical protein